jgi:hypothetical protein
MYRVAIVIATPARRFFAPMGFTTAKRTANPRQALGIARTGKKENPAMPTPGQAGSQMRFVPQNRSQHQIIIQNQRGHLALAIPVRSKLKILRDPDCKKLNDSVNMLR